MLLDGGVEAQVIFFLLVLAKPLLYSSYCICFFSPISYLIMCDFEDTRAISLFPVS